MFTVTRTLAILFIAISGVAAATSANATVTSTQPASAVSHSSTPSATTKKNAAISANQVAPVAVIGSVMFVGANLALGF